MAPKAGLDREAVILAALQLADTQGLAALTLAALAARLGIRTPSLYNHVAGLPGLQRELALRGARDLGARLARATAGKSGPDAVRALAAAYRAFVKEHPGQYGLLIQAPANAPAPDQERAAASHAIVEVGVAALAAYQLAAADALHAVRALRSAIHGFATLELAGGFGLDLSVEESFRRLVDLLIAGIDQLHRAYPPDPGAE